MRAVKSVLLILSILGGALLSACDKVLDPDSVMVNPNSWSFEMTNPADNSVSAVLNPRFSITGISHEGVSVVIQLYDDDDCTNDVGSPVSVSGTSATITDVIYAGDGSEDGNKVFHVIAAIDGIASPCVDTGLNYQLDTSGGGGGGGSSGINQVGTFQYGLTHTMATGSSRVLIFNIAQDLSATDITHVTYGGQSMTQIANRTYNDGSDTRQEMWMLKEAGIAAASNSNFVIMGGGGSNHLYSSFTLSGVDQNNPLADVSSDSAAHSYINITLTNIVVGGMTVMSIANGDPCTAAGVATGYTVSAVQYDDQICEMTSFKQASSTADETATLTTNSYRRMVGIGAHFNPE